VFEYEKATTLEDEQNLFAAITLSLFAMYVNQKKKILFILSFFENLYMLQWSLPIMEKESKSPLCQHVRLFFN